AQSIDLCVLTGTTSFTPAVQPGQAVARAQVARATISLLNNTLDITGINSSASSTLVRCSQPSVLAGSSFVASVLSNGKPGIPAGGTAQTTVIPIIGGGITIGTLVLNEHIVTGNTVTQNAVHLTIPGLVNLVLGSSTASASCGS